MKLPVCVMRVGELLNRLFLCIAFPGSRLSRSVTMDSLVLTKDVCSTSTCAPMRELMPLDGLFS